MSEKDVEDDKSNPTGKCITKEQIKRARPQVVASAKLGCTDKEIGTIVGLSENAVKRHLRKELDEGRGDLRGGLRKAQLEAAINGKNPTMLIWLGKVYLGQREPKQSHEVDGYVIVEKKVFQSNDKKD